MIVAAAVLVKESGEIRVGKTHSKILGETHLLDRDVYRGFVTEKGVFLYRTEAYEEAICCGQTVKDEEDIRRGLLHSDSKGLKFSDEGVENVKHLVTQQNQALLNRKGGKEI